MFHFCSISNGENPAIYQLHHICISLIETAGSALIININACCMRCIQLQGRGIETTADAHIPVQVQNT